MECCAEVQFVGGRGNLKELCMRCRAKPIQTANCLLSQLRNPVPALFKSIYIEWKNTKEKDPCRSMQDLDQIISIYSGLIEIQTCSLRGKSVHKIKGTAWKTRWSKSRWKLSFLTVIFVHLTFRLPSRHLYDMRYQTHELLKAPRI